MPYSPYVVVNLSGGNIQGILTNLPIDVVVVDWDNIEAGDQAVNFPIQPLADLSEEMQEQVNLALEEEPQVACLYSEASRLFDQITGASFYGQHFRAVLGTDPEAHLGAVLLERALLRVGVKGMTNETHQA